ncbi:hypothetical protein BH753_gp034 [Bacillus phage Shbh1]|uniref:Uncharacterized protein n=1 Tax=Bacillus phage Shbh1 TaxID=1796992 RepID=A0A142F159_9CAUD|nr:hypothetical protein BH753_gp034 [Bacillus phage Shbh1]AMQ66516.1 hypothetical protein [Bacillus phage Shbh1]
MGKVFKMNDYDWVYAENEEQAKRFYLDFSGCDEFDLEIKEVSLQDKMLYEVDRLPLEEQKMVQEMNWFAGELCAYKTFEWVIKQDNIKAPDILATIEG